MLYDLCTGLIPISQYEERKLIYGPRREKTCLGEFVNNKGADQPARPRSLIGACDICLLESIISKLATSEISFF